MIDGAQIAGLREAARAIGLLDDEGNLDESWLAHPIERARSILSNPGQRRALLALLDQLAPATPVDGEDWHHLLPHVSRGDLAVTVRREGAQTTLGVAGLLTADGMSVRASLPLVRASDGPVEVVAAGPDGPLAVELSARLPAGTLRVRTSVVAWPRPDAWVTLAVEGLAGGDIAIDSRRLGPDALQAALRVIAQQLGGAATVTTHLLGLFGLAGSEVPPFPFAEVLHDDRAWRRWLDALVVGVPAPMRAWLGHLGGLLGTAAASGDGTRAAPWSARLFAVQGVQLDLQATVERDAAGARRLVPSLAMVVAPALLPARLVASLRAFAIPLDGSAPAEALPGAQLYLEVPRPPDFPATAAFDWAAARAGLTLDAAGLRPLLELDGVRLSGAPARDLDLTDVHTLTTAGAQATVGLLMQLLGLTGSPTTNPALRALVHLVRLVGLLPLEGDPAWQVDYATLANDPLGAIARLHREALAAGSWAPVLAEVAGLFGVDDRSGLGAAGTVEHPWTVLLFDEAPLELRLAAWNEATGGVQRLRLGLQIQASAEVFFASLSSALLGFDLPPTGEGEVRLMAAQHLRLGVMPPPVPSLGGVSVNAERVAFAFDWAPGAPPDAYVEIAGLAVSGDGSDQRLEQVRFPPPAGAGRFDVANPLGGVGLTAAAGHPLDFESLLCLLLARGAHDWGGVPAWVAAALVGVHRGLPGTPTDWPRLSGFLADPPRAFRGWLASLARSRDALPAALAWGAALLGGSLPRPGITLAPAVGSGTVEDPLAAAIANGLELVAWVEPDGPDAAWVAALADEARAARDFAALLAVARRLGRADGEIREALRDVDEVATAAALDALATALAGGDGVAPLASARLVGARFVDLSPLAAGHAELPSLPAVVAEVASLAATVPDARAILVGPPFVDGAAWEPLVARLTGGDATLHAHLDRRGPAPPLAPRPRCFTVDLPAGDEALAALVAEVRALPGAPRALIVAASASGLAARRVAEAHAADVAALVTVGTPFGGAPLDHLRDGAEALRLLQRLVGADLDGVPTAHALAHLWTRLDGYVAGAVPRPLEAPTEAIPADPATATAAAAAGGSSVPMVALGGALGPHLLESVRDALARRIVALPARRAPTHMGLGLRIALAPETAPLDGDAGVHASARFDLFRLPLAVGATSSVVPSPLRLRLELTRPSGWLAGVPGPTAVRARSLAWGLDLAARGGRLVATPLAIARQVADHGPTTLFSSGAPARALVGAALAAADAGPGSPLATLLAQLGALGLAAPVDARHGAFVGDALEALALDPATTVGAALATALDGPSGLLGARATATGWERPSGPVTLYCDDACVGVRARTWMIGRGALTFDARLDVDSGVPALELDWRWGPLRLRAVGGELTLDGDSWFDTISLSRPDAAALHGALNRSALALLASSAASALVESALGPRFQIGPLAGWIGALDRLFSRDGDGGLDADRINDLLQLAAQLLGQPAGPGLALPGGLWLVARGVGNGLATTALALESESPLFDVLELSIGLAIDPAWHVSPWGRIVITLAPPAGASWPRVTVSFGADPAGVRLTVETDDMTLRLLPTFGGFPQTAAQAEALLLWALDQLAVSFAPSQAMLVSVARDLAAAIGLCDPPAPDGSFSARAFRNRAVAWRRLGEGDLGALGFAPPPAFDALARLANLVLPPTMQVAASGPSLTWSPALPGLIGHPIVELDWPPNATTGVVDRAPGVQAGVEGLHLGVSPLTLDARLGWMDAPVAWVRLTLDLQPLLHLALQPVIHARVDASGVALRFLPLGAAAPAPVGDALPDGVMIVDLAPRPEVRFAGTGGALVDALFRLGVTLVWGAVQDRLATQQLWPGARGTVLDALRSGRLVDADGALVLPATATDFALQLLGALLVGSPEVPIGGHFRIAVVNEAGQLGVKVKALVPIPLGEVVVSVRLGPPRRWDAEVDCGVTLFFCSALPVTGGVPRFVPAPRLRLSGVGVGVDGAPGHPLLDTDRFKVGGVAAYLDLDVSFLDGSLNPSLRAQHLGGALELNEVGLPVGQASSAGGNNTVAASLMHSDSSSGGDQAPAQPTASSLLLRYRNEAVELTFEGEEAIWIGIHAAFGPLYIDQIGLGPTPGGQGVKMLLDAAVHIAGIAVEVNELSLSIPFTQLSHPEFWRLDLRGLALGYSGGSVSVAGGLLKNEGPPLEYDGVLMVNLSGRCFAAIGAYSRPRAADGDEYTSIFGFVALPITIGGPPFLFITGLAAGMGYNRQLHVPTDINQIPSFPLLAALDGSSLANDPMAALLQMGTAMPPSRGSYWMAAGLRFTTYVIIETRAIVYMALDRELEIGLMGVSRLEYPPGEYALVNVELALVGRYSTADRTLAIRGQLTDNSWVLSRDCQLTGGFAFYLWFDDGQFVQTVGGYHPSFQRPERYPIVPRVGLHWSVADLITVSGELYLTLTSSCVMTGFGIELSYNIAPFHVWFHVSADFLLSWDPFWYEATMQISLGARFHTRVAGAEVDFGFQLAASLDLKGPPAHGNVHVDLGVAQVTVTFGPPASPPGPLDWESFAAKYLTAGDEESSAVELHVESGLLPPSPPSAQQAPGTADEPWRVGGEFAFATVSRAPASAVSVFTGAAFDPSSVPEVGPFGAAPLDWDIGGTLGVELVPLAGPPLRPGSVRVEVLNEPVPEGIWHRKDVMRTASARNLRALTGFRVSGTATRVPALAPVIDVGARSVDAPEWALPLPLAPTPQAAAWGTLADRLRTLTVDADRLASLWMGDNATPLAISAMARRVGLARPSALYHPPSGTQALPPPRKRTPVKSLGAVALAAPRLEAILQARGGSLRSASSVPRTTVEKALAREPKLPRATPGVPLHPLTHFASPRSIPVTTRRLLHPQLGGASGRAQRTLFAAPAGLAAGQMQLWQLPASKKPWHVTFAGDAAARVVALSARGRVLLDVEGLAGALVLPVETARVAVANLGVPWRGLVPARARGAVSAWAAPLGQRPIVGWQASSKLAQVAGNTLLGRGASLALGQRLPHSAPSFVTAGTLPRGLAIATTLPIETDVVVLSLDRRAPGDDLLLTVEGAQLPAKPWSLERGTRRTLAFEVQAREGQALTLSVGSAACWQLAGVIGLRGPLAEWAASLTKGVPAVPDGPLTTEGEVRVEIRS